MRIDGTVNFRAIAIKHHYKMTLIDMRLKAQLTKQFTSFP